MAATLTPHSLAKRVGEKLDYSDDFTNRLTGGKTISAGTAVVTIYSRSAGYANTTTAMLSGSAAINGSSIEFTLLGGTAGRIYDVIVKCTLNTGEIVEDWIELAVYGPSA